MPWTDVYGIASIASSEDSEDAMGRFPSGVIDFKSGPVKQNKKKSSRLFKHLYFLRPCLFLCITKFDFPMFQVSLAKTRVELMQANSQLYEAVRQKVDLGQQLEQWQVCNNGSTW